MSKFIEVETVHGSRMLVNLSEIRCVYEIEKGEPPEISFSDNWDISLDETYYHFFFFFLQISEVEEL